MNYKYIDQTGDLNGQTMHRLLNLHGAPDYIKQASSRDIYGPEEGLSDSYYADPVTRQFPTHTKEATWVSLAFLFENTDKLPNHKAQLIENRLLKKASDYGIAKDATRLKTSFKKLANDPLNELDNDDFALTLKLPDGSIERHYPLRNASEVKEAAYYLRKFQDTIPLVYRQEIAGKIMEKAAAYGAGLGELEEFIDKQAGYGTCAVSDIVNLVNTRLRLLKTAGAAEVKSVLNDVLETCKTAASLVRRRENLVKLAGIIDEVDRYLNLHTSYYSAFRRPEDVLFGVTQKIAEEFVTDNCTTITGKMYKLADLKKLPLEDIRETFGDEFAKEVSISNLLVSPEKLAEQLSSLPRPEVELLDRLLASRGIYQIAKSAEVQDSSPWYDISSLRKIAAKRETS